jgi:hypothetical protein
MGFPADFTPEDSFNIRNKALGSLIGLVTLFRLVGGPYAISANIVS